MEDFLVTGIFFVIGLLTTAVVSSMFFSRFSFPYTIGLVIVGWFFGMLAYHWQPLALLQDIDLSPGIILYLILPTLIFDAAINIDLSLLRRNLGVIAVLAVFGLLGSAAIIGYSLSWLTPLSLGAALLFGALISATDPVAVMALFHEVGAPARLSTLMDGESLLNDATAIVLFIIILSWLGISVGPSFFNMAAHPLFSFSVVLFGGIAVGMMIGFLASLLLYWNTEGFISQLTISFIAAYLSFLVADHLLHVSGVMSTLAAGITLRYRANLFVNPVNLKIIGHFWNYFAFIANSVIFLLLGITEQHVFARMFQLHGSLWPVLWVIPVVVLARALVVYGLVGFCNIFSKPAEKISTAYQTVLVWGGLRGAIPVALVLTIPKDVAFRPMLVDMTLGFVLFTLLVQGTTVKKLMKKLHV